MIWGHIVVIDSTSVAILHKRAEMVYLFGFEKEMRSQNQKMVHEGNFSKTLF